MQMSFEGQRSGEEVICIFRRHIISAKKGLFFLIVAVMIGIIPLLLWPGDSHAILLFIVMVLIGLFGAGYSYILWYFSFYLLTTERLRQCRQKGIFQKIVVDLDLQNIQSTSYAVSGLFATILDYGTILIQTGAGDLVMSGIKDPEGVYNKLENAVHEYCEGGIIVNDSTREDIGEAEEDEESALNGEISYEED